MNNSFRHISLDKSYDRTIVIGDVHGCFDEMMELITKCEFSEKDALISVGDMIDRGPKSWEVASFFKNTGNAFSVLGNHERRVSGVIKGTSIAAWSQLHCLSKLPQEEYNHWSIWFDSLPAVIETEHAIITHARLDPYKSLTEQDSFYTCAVGGEGVIIECNEDGVPLWYLEISKINEVFKPICFGHLAYKQIELVERKLYSLDTKAVKGGELTAVIFPDYKIISVPVKENYYDLSYKEWMDYNYSLKDIETIELNKISSMLKQKTPNEIEQKIISSFVEAFHKYAFLQRAERVKGLIPQKLGVVPIEGKERGEYFIRLNGDIKDVNQRKLIRKLLTQKKIDIEMFFSLFPTLTLINIDDIFKSIED